MKTTIQKVYNEHFKKHYGNITNYLTWLKSNKEEILIFGDDECFETNEFYQYGVSLTGRIYRCYYHITDGEGNSIKLDSIDYGKPYRIEEVTDEFYN